VGTAVFPISRVGRGMPWCWCRLIVLATISPIVALSEQMVLITNTDMFGQLDISRYREAEPERERPGRERPNYMSFISDCLF
jgi:hypothetical protein